ncbi:MAG TPA: PIN domain-containing protein [Gaiella sp.]|jgi:predicted nucleic acid-binding protein
MPILLDTTVLIDLLRGRPGAIAGLEALARSGERPFTSAVNLEELYRGLRPREEDAAASLASGLRLAPLARAEGARAGSWRREHAARGETLSQADCLVGAAAVGVGARLATGNPRHFPMPELRVEHWVAGA